MSSDILQKLSKLSLVSTFKLHEVLYNVIQKQIIATDGVHIATKLLQGIQFNNTTLYSYCMRAVV